jgi:hypothetical protein
MNNYKQMFKIMIQDDKGNLKTLFHGLNGSKTLPRDVWLEANEKMVRDGSSKTWYLSGFHVLETKEECEEYLKFFKKPLNRIIVPCLVKGELRPKSHSRHPVYLAKFMKLI